MDEGRNFLYEAMERKAQELAVDVLGEVIDTLHEEARRRAVPTTMGRMAKETYRMAADLISEKRKEIQLG